MIAPSHYRFNLESKKEKLAQYGRRVWGLTEGDTDALAKAAIEKTEAFFHSLETTPNSRSTRSNSKVLRKKSSNVSTKEAGWD